MVTKTEQLTAKVYHCINEFLRKGEVSPILRGVEASATPISLFEFIAQPKPEIRAQEAMFPALRASFPSTEREYHWSDAASCRLRKFDFLVSDGDEHVIVELKHYSAHQTGGFRNLLGPIYTRKGKQLQSLWHDCSKPRPYKLVQVGLFTAVEEWAPVRRWKSINNRFIQSYVRRPLPLTVYEHLARRDLQTWTKLGEYTCGESPLGPESFTVGPVAEFLADCGTTVKGRVNFLIGLPHTPGS